MRAELQLLDALLRRSVDAARHGRGGSSRGAPWGHGVFSGGDEIDVLLAGDSASDPARVRRTLDARVALGGSEGASLPMGWIARTFGLSTFDLQVIVLCLAPEVDAKY